MYQIGRVLRIARAMLGIKQNDMAERVGISATHYSSLESGRYIPGLNALKKISEATHMSIEAITILNTPAPRELDLEHRQSLELVKSTLFGKFITDNAFKKEDTDQ